MKRPQLHATVLNLLQRLHDTIRPQPQEPTLYCYGDEHLGLDRGEMQPVMEWLFLSMMNAGYDGDAHLCWYDHENPCPGIEGGVLEGLKQEELIFGYRWGGRMWALPEGYHWRMMPEHPSMRVYQLEVEEDWLRLRESDARDSSQRRASKAAYQ